MKPNRFLLTALAFAVIATADARANHGRDPFEALRLKSGGPAQVQGASEPAMPMPVRISLGVRDDRTLPR
jgi:hypothetical protein